MSDRAKGLQSARSQSRSPHTVQRGSTWWTVTRFPQAVQENCPFAKAPAGQNSTHSSSAAVADETLSCDSSTSSPFPSEAWTASRNTLLVGCHGRSVNFTRTFGKCQTYGGSRRIQRARSSLKAGTGAFAPSRSVPQAPGRGEAPAPDLERPLCAGLRRFSRADIRAMSASAGPQPDVSLGLH